MHLLRQSTRVEVVGINGIGLSSKIEADSPDVGIAWEGVEPISGGGRLSRTGNLGTRSLVSIKLNIKGLHYQPVCKALQRRL